jgi:hypothetical protein
MTHFKWDNSLIKVNGKSQRWLSHAHYNSSFKPLFHFWMRNSLLVPPYIHVYVVGGGHVARFMCFLSIPVHSPGGLLPKICGWDFQDQRHPYQSPAGKWPLSLQIQKVWRPWCLYWLPGILPVSPPWGPEFTFTTMAVGL